MAKRTKGSIQAAVQALLADPAAMERELDWDAENIPEGATEPDADPPHLAFLAATDSVAYKVRDQRDALQRELSRNVPALPPAATEPPPPASGRPSKEALALAVLADHPDWSDTKIADAAGCNRTTLYTFRKFMAAREILREGRNNRPRGRKLSNGTIEAWDNSSDE